MIFASSSTSTAVSLFSASLPSIEENEGRLAPQDIGIFPRVDADLRVPVSKVLEG